MNAEANEETLFANAACLARWMRELGRVRTRIGTEAGRGARAVDADAQQLDAEVGVEGVEGVSDECRGCDIERQAWVSVWAWGLLGRREDGRTFDVEGPRKGRRRAVL